MDRTRRCSAELLLLASFLSAQKLPHGPFGRYTGPNSLGPYSIQRDISMKSFLATFGTKPTGKYTYCFADKEHGLYLCTRPSDDGFRRVAMVFLSSFPNCMHLPVLNATIDPALWKTSEGIGIGSTKADVLHVYHQPVFFEKLEKGKKTYEIIGIRETEASKVYVGDSSYLYSFLLDEKNGCDDLRATRIGFSKDKLISIAISYSE